MTQQHAPGYEFEGLPLAPVDAGTNLLVTGPALAGTRDLLLRLLLGDDGVIIVTTDTGAQETLADFERVGGSAASERVRVVDCVQQNERRDEFVSGVKTPADLTGIGIEFSNHYEEAYARGYDAVRTAIYTLTPLLVYSDDPRAVFRFVNTVTSRIRTADGLGVCAIDPDAHGEQVVGSITQPFDARVDVRSTDEGLELRVMGLPDQPSEWTPVPPLG
ncbi:DUF7504 family protein [Haloarcula marina]|uniref:DUF7504 family protein n=1 Tax=Haloarcula marina TaxID=2961574 RepID=UPI0020B8A968|nr:hypothetical protein [Halomicroarcula marina]